MVHLKKHSDGHLLVESGGHLVKDCGSAADCARCDNDYYQYQVVFSGITVSTDCLDSGTHTASGKVITPPTVNGIWVVTQRAGCVWTYQDFTEATSFALTRHWGGDFSCAGSNFDRDQDNLEIEIIKISDTEWRIDFWLSPSGVPYGMYVFQRTSGMGGYIDVASGNCESFSGNNGITSPFLTSQYGLWPCYGGSATITPY